MHEKNVHFAVKQNTINAIENDKNIIKE